MQKRLKSIEAQMEDLELVHWYWLEDTWKTLMAQKTLLIDLLGKD